MATPYKTPGVYIEEIPKFPPSVAPVETAIPAFIGYTEQAKEFVANDLILKPTRITSMVEYSRLFGGPQPETGIDVSIIEKQDATGATTSLSVSATLAEADRSKHIMYYALQMFFANGGGPCYIVSVGGYKTLGTALEESELKDGLDTLRKVDAPTLLVFPEAQYLGTIADFKTLHDLAYQRPQRIRIGGRKIEAAIERVVDAGL